MDKNIDSFSVSAIVLGVCLLAWNCFQTYRTIQDYYLGIDSKNWPHTIGKIIDHSVLTHRRSKSPNSYEPIVKYSYTVSGKLYESNCLQIPPDELKTYEQANDVLSKFPKNASTVVYYNPADQSTSCLLMSYLNDGRYGGSKSYILNNSFRLLFLFVPGAAALLRGIYPFKKRSKLLENIFNVFSPVKHCVICNKMTKEIFSQGTPRQFLGIKYQSAKNKPLCRRHLVEEFKNLFLIAKGKFLVFYPDLENKADENYVYDVCKLSSLEKQQSKAWIGFFSSIEGSCSCGKPSQTAYFDKESIKWERDRERFLWPNYDKITEPVFMCLSCAFQKIEQSLISYAGDFVEGIRFSDGEQMVCITTVV